MTAYHLLKQSLHYFLIDFGMILNDKKVAYASYSSNLDAPGDRRRFIFYANERNIKFERADTKFIYDVVYLTYGCDLGAWISYKKRNPSVKIIFELIDSYLLQSSNALTTLKGPVRFIMGHESKLFLNYKSALTEIISLSDAVVCATDIQKNMMSGLNRNIHISLDYFQNDIKVRKKDYKTKKKIKIVWEGQPYWVKNLILLNNVFKSLNFDFEVDVITDVTANYYLGLKKIETSKILKKLNCEYNFIQWDKENISSLLADCDLAIIPIDPTDSFSHYKPENKLLFFWEIGLPVLTSNTPAYNRVMEQAGLDCTCSTFDDWRVMIERFAFSEESQKKILVDRAASYLKKFHSKELILNKWDLIFKSV